MEFGRRIVQTSTVSDHFCGLLQHSVGDVELTLTIRQDIMRLDLQMVPCSHDSSTLTHICCCIESRYWA
eukprot:1224572-Amphidinium_carterae.1